MNFIDRAQQIIDNYSDEEQAAIKDLPIYLTRCFSPHTFNSFNFLTNCTSANELWKFFDSQQEFRTAYYGSDLLGVYSEKELELIKEISFDIGELTRQFNRKTVPVGLNHQLSSIPTIRILEQLRESNRGTLDVLEIGGGSGMLGHMCHRLGFKYSNFDITQSFYTLNSIVYETLYGQKFTDRRSATQYKELNHDFDADNEISLIPWWQFVDVEYEVPKFQIVVMNHSFFEISRKAMAFILTRLAHAVDGRVYLLVSEWGSTRFTELDQPFLQWLQAEFDFRKEPFDGNPKINPNGTVLLSFQKTKPGLDVYSLPIDDRLNMIPSHQSDVVSKVRRVLSSYTPNGMKILFKKILASTPASEMSNIFGDIYPEFSSIGVSHAPYSKNFVDLKRLIREIEEHFGKPCFTEDEAFGFYISRKDHA